MGTLITVVGFNEVYIYNMLSSGHSSKNSCFLRNITTVDLCAIYRMGCVKRVRYKN